MLRRPEVSYDALLELAGQPDWMRLPPDPPGGVAGAVDGAAGAGARACAGDFDDRLPAQVRAQVEVRAKYAGYIERQEDEVERQRRNEETRLPDDLDYAQVAGLSHEVRQKLSEARPATIGMAGRLPGMTPAAVSILLVHLKKRSYKARAQVA
jgi:tRNA uridine 5-carboxymethylaminomethyl modification enzyme